MKHLYTLLFITILTSFQFVCAQNEGEIVDLNSAEDSKLEISQNRETGFNLETAVDKISLTQKETELGFFYKLSSNLLMKTFKNGYPDLPVISRLIEVPFGAKVKINIVDYDEEVIKLSDLGINSKIYPAQPSKSKCEDCDDDETFYFKEEVYKLDEFLNKEIINFEDKGILRYKRLGRIEIAPIQYNPSQNVLKVINNIKLEVKFVGADMAKTREMREKYANHFFGDLSGNIINYKPLESKELIDQNPVTYVIVSDRMFESQLQPFIEWKEKKGFNVITAYTDNIGSTTTEIKTYLEDLYNNPNPTAPSFVLFVGDVGEIPAWDGDAGSHVTDLEYCEYTGDNLPEVYYGRFSAQNTTQLQPQIDKTLEYEKYEMADPSYLSEALLVAGDDESWEDVHGNGAMWYADNYYFNSDNDMNSHLFLQDPPNGNAAVHDSIIANVNSGISYANYTAHCSSSGWGTPSFTTSDVANLTNEGKYGLWVGNCCLSVKFDNDECFGEAALRAENSGAIGDIGGSNSTYWDEDYWWGVGYIDNPVEEPAYEESGLGVYDGMFHTKTNEVDDPSTWYVTQGQAVVCGNLAVEASTSTRKEYYWEIYHLMGDPSLTPYLGVPEAMTVSATPSTLMIGMNSLTVNTEAYAYVALSFNGELLDAKVADATGQAALSFESLANVGEADLVVTAQNRQPYIGTITVSPSDQPYVVLDSTSIDDAAGNGNGEADYGESISLDSELKNVSDAYDALGVHDSLYCTDPYITLTDSLEGYGDIAPEAESLIEGAFAFDVSDDVPDQHVASFSMHVTGQDASSNDYTWVSDFSITLNAPVLEIGDMTIDDASGNGDGILDPGESADLIVEVTNSGHADISNVNGTLTSSATELTINSGSSGPVSIATGTTQTLTFNVTADGSTPIGTPVEVDIAVTGASNDQYTDASTKQLVIGEIPEYLISQGGTVSTCVGLFYDSGGPSGEYSNEENYTMTFEPATSGNVIKAEFISFAVESNYDWLKIYDGSSTSDELIGSYDSGNQPGTIIASNTQGALTFEFDSDYSVTKAGWEAEISCVEMNEVAFTVTDGVNPIEDAQVTFAGSSIMTDGSGVASFVVENGTYDYTVSKTGYTEATGSLDVSSDISQDITLNVLTYDITFNLYEEDGSTPIEGDITFDGSTQSTTGGTYTFSDVEYGEGKSYSITVNNDYYADYNGTVDVTQARTLEITMEPNLYDVNIGAKDTAGAMISGCSVTIDGTTHVTNGSGIASFSLSQGSYTYDVTHPGYTSGNGSIEVDGLESSYSDTVELTIESYSITFEVYESDGVTTLEASVTFDGETQTATGGTCTFSDIVYSGVKSYEVTAEEHVTESGQIDLTSDMTKEILMDSLSYSVTVSVSDEESNALSGATVEMNGEEQTTGSNGTVNYSVHKGNYTCRVNMSGYKEDVNDVTIDQDQTLNVTLLKYYDVTFTVLADSSDSPISGATVTVDGTDHTTDSNGEATTTLVSGTYDYTVTADGYKDASGSINVTGNTGTNIRLEADISGIDMLSDQLRVYPNPADEELIIEFTGSGKMQYELLDMTGKTVQRGSLPQQTNKLDVSTHASGIYFIRVRNDKQYVNYKLIIE